MPETCGVEYPDDPSKTCTKPVPCYFSHQATVDQRPVGLPISVTWSNDAVPPPKKSRKQEAVAIAEAIVVQKPVGPPVLSLIAKDGPAFDPRMYEGTWNNDWYEYATKTFEEFLKQRGTSFTTPEDLWPLVDAPQEKREMVRPVQTALRLGWMHEVAAKRLQGTYRTKDGVEFKMNKLVPVYASRIFVLT